jgi:hypothetical protein
MHKHTFYVAKEMNFVAISNIIAELEHELSANDYVDIISLFTGEVYAIRNTLGLWEILI